MLIIPGVKRGEHEGFYPQNNFNIFILFVKSA
jgi:hypothetical protein